jgi:hypothetical protein
MVNQRDSESRAASPAGDGVDRETVRGEYNK